MLSHFGKLLEDGSIGQKEALLLLLLLLFFLIWYLFSVPRSHAGYITFGLHVSLVFLLAVTVAQTSLFDDRGSFEEYCQVFCGLSFSLGLSDVFLVVRQCQ